MIQIAPRATIADLYHVEGKAELIGGKIVHLMASGFQPSEVAFLIAISLRAFALRIGVGVALPDGIGYAIRPPLSNGRESFSPDASYYAGPLPSDPMRFIEGAPTFAVEVRSEEDYGPAAERALADKRADYFEAGTKAVWDVDPKAKTIASYRNPSLQRDKTGNGTSNPLVFHIGDNANAEPAVPGWTMAVIDCFNPAA
ncbi:MAG TPA: Uma2 family endonuclease [Pirellulaceae bacterium]|nr:Uma2 family endonuclease [Pirellulaceae bacterium]